MEALSAKAVIARFGAARGAGTARRFWCDGHRRSPYGLPGDVLDGQCRYLAAAVNGVLVASIYAPNGNPSLAPNLITSSAWLEATERPRGWNCTRPERPSCWREITTLCRQISTSIQLEVLGSGRPSTAREPRCVSGRSRARLGPILFARSISNSRCTPFWDYKRKRWETRRRSASRPSFEFRFEGAPA